MFVCPYHKKLINNKKWNRKLSLGSNFNFIFNQIDQILEIKNEISHYPRSRFSKPKSPAAYTTKNKKSVYISGLGRSQILKILPKT